MTKLTDQERETLNAAMAIIDRHTAQGSSWQIGAARYSDSPFSFGITYFDSNKGSARGQHGRIRGETFADKVQTVLDIEAKAVESAEANRKARVQMLRKELLELTGEAA